MGPVGSQACNGAVGGRRRDPACELKVFWRSAAGQAAGESAAYRIGSILKTVDEIITSVIIDI